MLVLGITIRCLGNAFIKNGWMMDDKGTVNDEETTVDLGNDSTFVILDFGY